MAGRNGGAYRLLAMAEGRGAAPKDEATKLKWLRMLGGPFMVRRVAFLVCVLSTMMAMVLPASVSADRPLDPADLEAFFDGVMAAHFQAYRIPGAAVAVVKDGEILFAKGYGYADIDTRTPVDPAETLFRIGSVSKLFT